MKSKLFIIAIALAVAACAVEAPVEHVADDDQAILDRGGSRQLERLPAVSVAALLGCTPAFAPAPPQCETAPNAASCKFPGEACDWDQQCGAGLVCDLTSPTGGRCGSCLAQACPPVEPYVGHCTQATCPPYLSPRVQGEPCVWREECAGQMACGHLDVYMPTPHGYCGICH